MNVTAATNDGEAPMTQQTPSKELVTRLRASANLAQFAGLHATADDCRQAADALERNEPPADRRKLFDQTMVAIRTELGAGSPKQEANLRAALLGPSQPPGDAHMIVGSDKIAATVQSMADYRKMLLQTIKELIDGGATLSVRPTSDQTRAAASNSDEMRPVVVAVSGGRSYNDAAKVFAVLDAIHKERCITLLIQGECPVGDGGADELARRWAISRQVNYVGVPPKVRRHGWPSAGPKRNEEMATFHPALWVLFPGNNGTANAKQIAEANGIEVIEVQSK